MDDPEPDYRARPPQTLGPSAESARAKYTATIKASRAVIKSTFTPGCRIEFRRPPASPDNPTVRIGKGRFIRLVETPSGKGETVVYSIDGHNDGKLMNSAILTFLADNPVPIPED